MSVKRVLFSFAHPDDESFGSGGLIARLVSEGAEVRYVCGTDGSAGTVAAKFIEQHGSIKAVRYAELECATQVLGFSQVYKLDYADSGMMGSPENENPACLWQADEDEVVGKLVAILREFQPQVVVTFDPYGGYGHPDHIFMHRATTRAFHAAADPAQFPQAGAPYQPAKLYYSVFPRWLVYLFIFMALLKRQNPRRVGVNKDFDLIAVLQNLPRATTRIKISQWLETWNQASDCHASQGNFRSGIPPLVTNWLSSRHLLSRAYPLPNRHTERDMFEGVTL